MFDSLLNSKVIRDIGLVGIVVWLVSRLISDTNQQSMVNASTIAQRVSTDMGRVMASAASDMAGGIAREVSTVVAAAVNDSIRNQTALLDAVVQPTHTDDKRVGTIDDPTQGEGDTPWWLDATLANDGGPMTRPIDPTDSDWPDPSPIESAHRTAMVSPGASANLLDDIAALPPTNMGMEFGADGFPLMQQGWSPVPRPDMAGETWQE